MIKYEKCPICNSTKYENLDHIRDHEYWYQRDFRDKEESVGFKVCLECGFVDYAYKPEDELKKSYDNQRSIMQAMNIVTCNRKNEYHKAFLFDCVDPSILNNILDIGCAQGSFLSLYSNLVPNIYGSEWSDGFAAFAKNEYGVTIDNDWKESDRKYDLISLYHVLEHMQYPDVELEEINKKLNPEGFLYISVPLFFETLDESSGSVCNDFENIFHLNHVNVFSRQALKNILHKTGFKIIKENDKLYGYTVLCKKSEKKPIVKESWEQRKEQLENYKKAIDFINIKENSKALEIEPLFPDAYILESVNVENMKDIKKASAILEKGLDLMPDSQKLLFQKGRLYFQWDEQTPEKTFYSNNIKESERCFKRLIEMKPANEDCFYFLGLIEGKYKKNYDQAVLYLKRCLEINPTKFVECYNFISYFYKEKEQDKS